jgi:hypothetical protein
MVTMVMLVLPLVMLPAVMLLLLLVLTMPVLLLLVMRMMVLMLIHTRGAPVRESRPRTSQRVSPTSRRGRTRDASWIRARGGRTDRRRRAPLSSSVGSTPSARSAVGGHLSPPASAAHTPSVRSTEKSRRRPLTSCCGSFRTVRTCSRANTIAASAIRSLQHSRNGFRLG